VPTNLLLSWIVHFSKLLMRNQTLNHSSFEKTTAEFETQASLFQAPERILDAPELVDDYYLNLLDWSSRNTLAIALSNTVYLWNAAFGTIHELMEAGGEGSDDYVTSVSWAGDGKHLAVGLGSSEVQLWDCEANKQVTSLTFSCVDSLP
jgi:WD40 repeat protein